MKRKLISSIFVILLLATAGYAQTYISGSIGYATWDTTGSPYIITGYTVASILTIEAGVTVQFNAYCRLEISEALLVYGTETDSVIFTAGESNWEYIYLNDNGDFHEINYAVFEGAIGNEQYGVLRLTNELTTFKHCIFRSNESPVRMISANGYWDNATIFENCDFYGNNATQSLIYLSGQVNAVEPRAAYFKKCRFFNNNSRELINNWHAFAVLYQCEIFDNNCDWALWMRGGVVAYCVFYNAVPEGNPVFHNMDIFDPGIVQNSIIWGNNIVTDHPEAMQIEYCDVQIATPGIGNISAEPMFADPANFNFHVQSGSPCIDAGNPGGFWVDYDGTRSDMGLDGGSGFVPRFTSIDFYQIDNFTQQKHFLLLNLNSYPVLITAAYITPTLGFSNAGPYPGSLEPYNGSRITITYTATGADLHSSLVLNSPQFIADDTASVALFGHGEGFREFTGSLAPDTAESYTYYYTLDNLIVPDGEQLTLEPGTRINFYENVIFKVEGNLQALGAEEDTIRFGYFEDEWGGMIFDNADGINNLDYVRIQGTEGNAITYGDGGGIYAFNTSLNISNSYFKCNQAYNTEMPVKYGGGIYALSCPQVVIENTTFYDCEVDSNGGGINIRYCPDVTLNNVELRNTFANAKGSGIYFDQVTATVDSCVIYNPTLGNQGDGIAIYAKNSDIDITRTVLNRCYRNNYSSSVALYNSNMTFDHSDICFNVQSSSMAAWNLIDPNSTLQISNSIFHEIVDFFNPSSYHNVTMTYSLAPTLFQGEGNIFGDPLITEECYLTSSSPCIDAGDPEAPLDPDNTRSDMGAYAWDGSGAWSGAVSGVWTAENSPYVIGDSIFVPAGDTLIVMPGTTIEFNEYLHFGISGALIINGTADDSVTITTPYSGTFDDIVQFSYLSTQQSSIIQYTSMGYIIHNLGPMPTTFDHCTIGRYYIEAGNSDGNVMSNCLCYAIINNGTGWTVINNEFDVSRGGSYDPFASAYAAYESEGVFINNFIDVYARASIEEPYWSAVSAGFRYCQGEFSHNTILAGAYAGSYASYGLRECVGTIRHNSADAITTGISQCVGSIFNNTIKNTNYGISSDIAIDPVKNNIIYDCIVGVTGQIEVQYTCFFDCPTPFADGAYAGPGVIYDDPLLINNWFLDPNSPCIDAGDPNPLYNDPDGTRDDMGANYFDQGAAYATVTLTPVGLPIQIPATGGSFDFNIAVENSGTAQIEGQVWCNILLPDSTLYGPVIGPVDLILPGGWTGDRNRTQIVPSIAPAGLYHFQAFIGVDEGNIWDSEKLDTGDGPSYSEWRNYGDPFENWISSGIEAEIPTTWSLDQNYPNPFNPVTVIRFAVPEAQRVSLTVYNMLGQQVAELVNGWRFAGYHEVTFDASELASGVYIYKLKTETYSSARKMVLVK